ncbi:MAG: hypothetical protein JSU64_03980 [candidate division WOR-3 bacterium]|nr:MAG: hypothetical protein JSU64_03980 [candidate division WOR-3 bacterium]
MIILVEPDKDVRKNLADLISRERIVGVDSIQEALQMLLKYKNDLDLIIANVKLLSEMLTKQLIERVCLKLSIAIPPVVAIYKETEEETKDIFAKTYKNYRVIKYTDKDLGFPNRYLEVIQKACPGLVIDYEKARDAWLKKQHPSDFVDPRTWLAEEGFIEALGSPGSEEPDKPDESDIVSSIKTILDEAGTENVVAEHKESKEDYKKMYVELKRKYDALLENVRAFMESVKKTNS